MRLPRGRPPALGVDSSFFNLTPPSAEAITPTNEDKTVVTETVEQSLVVKAKDPEAIAKNDVDRTSEVVSEKGEDRMGESPTTQVLPEQTSIVTDNPTTDSQAGSLAEDVQRVAETQMTGERVIPVDLDEAKTEATNGDTIILAERPDYNPNPHS